MVNGLLQYLGTFGNAKLTKVFCFMEPTQEHCYRDTCANYHPVYLIILINTDNNTDTDNDIDADSNIDTDNNTDNATDTNDNTDQLRSTAIATLASTTAL